MFAHFRLLYYSMLVLTLGIPGCSGCTRNTAEPPPKEAPAKAKPDPQPTADSAPAADSADAETNGAPVPPQEARPSAELSNQSEGDAGTGANDLPTGTAEGTGGGSGKTAPPQAVEVPPATGEQRSPAADPAVQIRRWLGEARKELAQGRAGKAYLRASDAAGLVRKVKSTGERAALKAETQALLNVIQPALKKSTTNINTVADDQPLIEQ